MQLTNNSIIEIILEFLSFFLKVDGNAGCDSYREKYADDDNGNNTWLTNFLYSMSFFCFSLYS